MIVLVSQDGHVKRMPLDIVRAHRGGQGKSLTSGWIRMLWEPDDGGEYDLAVLTNLGGFIRFPLSEIRPMGEQSPGVRAIRLQAYESVQDAVLVEVINAGK
jgi:DNA gyrase/topoisomerase IV subunit A